MNRFPSRTAVRRWNPLENKRGAWGALIHTRPHAGVVSPVRDMGTDGPEPRATRPPEDDFDVARVWRTFVDLDSEALDITHLNPPEPAEWCRWGLLRNSMDEEVQRSFSMGQKPGNRQCLPSQTTSSRQDAPHCLPMPLSINPDVVHFLTSIPRHRHATCRPHRRRRCTISDLHTEVCHVCHPDVPRVSQRNHSQ